MEKIINIKGQNFKSGDKVTCEIDTIKVNNAIIWFNEDSDRFFIFQNIKDGTKPSNKGIFEYGSTPEEHGYSYSWSTPNYRDSSSEGVRNIVSLSNKVIQFEIY